MVDDAVTVLSLLRSRGHTLATAESLTGGMLGEHVTAVPGASDVYRGGVIAYASDLKVAVLGVPAGTVMAHGVVSAETAAAMARGVRALTGATWAVSTTGVAGPDAQEGKPVGLVYVAVDGPAVVVRRLELSGDRETIRRAACAEALAALRETITETVGAID